MSARYAIEGSAVVVPARIALILERHLHLNELRVEVRGRSQELDEVLASWHAVALQAAEGLVGADPGRSAVPTPDKQRPSVVEGLTTRQVAELADCSIRAVTRAASEGRLAGQRAVGRWWFGSEEAAAWMAAREEEA